MKLNSLLHFLAVAERGSLRAAARDLEISQPAITRSVQELEKELGVVLFERRTKGVTVTPMGAVFLRRAMAVRNELRRAQDEIAQMRGDLHGQVCVCLSSVAHMAMLPNALRAQTASRRGLDRRSNPPRPRPGRARPLATPRR